MKDLLRYLKNVVKKKNTPHTGTIEPDLPNVSGGLHFYWDSQSGDFNVILEVEEEHQISAEVLGMLMCYISEGQMGKFLVEGLSYWCDSPEKMEFYTEVLRSWNVLLEIQEEEDKNLEEKNLEENPIVDPSDVFRLFKGNNNDN